MSGTKPFFRKAYQDIINSIAFYPSLIGLFFFAFAIFIGAIENASWIQGLKDYLSDFLVRDPDNARVIIGTVTAGVISLMVFSFSMVMVVLNRASATLSPRVLPGLISRKFHQIVLGYYLGTIIFSLILLIRTGNYEDKHASLPSIGILLSMAMCVVCLSLFVYFIHSISKNIEVDHILENIYIDTKKQLTTAKSEDSNHEKPDTAIWEIHHAPLSGYLKHLAVDALVKLCVQNQLQIAVLVPIGEFVSKDFPLFKLSKELKGEMLDEVYSHFVFYTEERVNDHYVFGLKQISEIAVKALSPGINDPGTALKGIDHLSDLFIDLAKSEKDKLIADDAGNLRLIRCEHSFEELLFRTFMPILHYGQHDVMVVKSLIDGVERIKSGNDRHKKSLKKLLKSIHSKSNEVSLTKWEKKYLG